MEIKHWYHSQAPQATGNTLFKLTTHIDELRILLASNDIDIISINETNLDEVISDNEVSIPGYDIIRRDRLSNGGVEYSLRNDLSEEALQKFMSRD